jgi:hypothetical protein
MAFRRGPDNHFRLSPKSVKFEGRETFGMFFEGARTAAKAGETPLKDKIGLDLSGTEDQVFECGAGIVKSA